MQDTLELDDGTVVAVNGLGQIVIPQAALRLPTVPSAAIAPAGDAPPSDTSKMLIVGAAVAAVAVLMLMKRSGRRSNPGRPHVAFMPAKAGSLRVGNVIRWENQVGTVVHTAKPNGHLTNVWLEDDDGNQRHLLLDNTQQVGRQVKRAGSRRKKVRG